MKRGFTLLELVIIIVIIGVLATMGISQYYPLRENALRREAQANLRLIIAAQRVYRMEQDSHDYYQSSGASTSDHISNINYILKLYLPFSSTRSWDYRTWGNNTTCCANATRITGASTFRMRCNETDPVQAGCP